MDENNVTRISIIYLLGFTIPQSIKCFVFFLFLMIYCVTVGGNLLIIALVINSRALQTPMYFFLSQLSTTDILLVTNILPNVLRNILLKEKTISFTDCLSQFYFFAMSEGMECFLLSVMSYDRYLAICKPLHYTLMMTHQFCWTAVIICWVLIMLIVMIITLTVTKLKFCGPNIIDHFFCDFDPILELSCSDITKVQLEVTLINAVFVVIPFFFIIASYTYIIVTIFKIQSVTGRKKAFSTCSSHLIVVSMYYGTLLCAYLVPKGQTLKTTKFMSLLYTVFTPLINPLVYSLRNKDLKQAAGKLIGQLKSAVNKILLHWKPCKLLKQA
ncbi:olfactory receptor 10A7-like [Hyperolius riggenbachi]|uniref:olfactory receptor 10A7-like n=1 Tax=Hyperolius riggenbachi TaxID=752182 RepID=UPI0035A2F94F